MNRPRHAVNNAYRDDKLNGVVIGETVRLWAIAHGADTAATLRKVLERHRSKPGRKPAPGGYTPEKKIIFAASAWARWLEPSIGRDAALAKVAAFYKIDERQVRRIAVDQKEKIPAEFIRDDWSDFP